MIPWPPDAAAERLRALGWVFSGHHGRFAFAYLQRGPVAFIECFVLHPRLRDGRYLRIAYRDMLDALASIGVQWAITFTQETAPLWRRLGAAVSPEGWVKVEVR